MVGKHPLSSSSTVFSEPAGHWGHSGSSLLKISVEKSVRIEIGWRRNRIVVRGLVIGEEELEEILEERKRCSARKRKVSVASRA